MRISFALGGILFLQKDSVSKGPKFQPKNIIGLKNILRGW
jgi:hypothetical protein